MEVFDIFPKLLKIKIRGKYLDIAAWSEIKLYQSTHSKSWSIQVLWFMNFFIFIFFILVLLLVSFMLIFLKKNYHVNFFECVTVSLYVALASAPISVPAPDTSFMFFFFVILLIISISRTRNAIRIPLSSKCLSLFLLPEHKACLTADMIFVLYHNIFYQTIWYNITYFIV